MVTLVGTGCGPESMTALGRKAVEEARILIGAGRMLDTVPETRAEKFSCYIPSQILEKIRSCRDKDICVLYSGDTGFYSGAASLLPLLDREAIPYRILPGISSLQRLSAALGQPWQDWRLCSAHGEKCSAVWNVIQGSPVFFLTSGARGPADLCRELTEAGLGFLEVSVGENLGYESEALVSGTAEEFAQRDFAPLNVMLCQPAPLYPRQAPGLPDEEFIREKVPMTKREVRAAAVSALQVTPADLCWDIGAGTGSVSIELSRVSRETWAIEQKEEALDLARRNREKFMAWNLHLLPGKAPEGMEGFPAPDAVFIGGSGGNLEEIVDFALFKNPDARICISAIALETLSGACRILADRGLDPQVTQIAVSRVKALGSLHLLMAQNPVFLITGAKK